MPERVHGICYLTERNGALTPTDRPLDPAALGGRDVELHVYTTAAEASAFVHGVEAHRSNHLRAAVGIGSVTHLAALERLGPDDAEDVRLVDHGGVEPLRAHNAWSWIRRLARVYERQAGPRSPTLWFQQPQGAAPARMRIEHRTYDVVQDGDRVCLRCQVVGDASEIRARLTAEIDSAISFTIDDGEVDLSLAKRAFAERVPHIHAIGRILDDCASRARRIEEITATRGDRRHCRIVELMLQGWSLRNSQGRGELRPPAESALKARTLSYAMLGRLIDADLIRPPAGREVRGHRQWNVVYGVGDLAGSAVRTGRAEGQEDLP
jgi:hypothetical protein